MTEAARAYLENERFQSGFCAGCEAIVRDSSGYDDCPSGQVPGDLACVRRHLYRNIETLLTEADEQWQSAE